MENPERINNGCMIYRTYNPRTFKVGFDSATGKLARRANYGKAKDEQNGGAERLQPEVHQRKRGSHRAK